MTNARGRLSRLNQEYGVDPVSGAPRLVFVDWAHATLLVGVSPDGAVYRSRDQATTWDKLNQVDGTPEALDVIPGRWHVATDEGVFRATDEGRTWNPIKRGLR